MQHVYLCVLLLFSTERKGYVGYTCVCVFVSSLFYFITPFVTTYPTTSHRWRSQSKDSVALDVRNIDRTFRFTDVTTGQFNFSISRIRKNFKYLHKGAPRRRRSGGLNFTTTVSVFSLTFSRNSRFSSHFVVFFPEIQYLPVKILTNLPIQQTSECISQHNSLPIYKNSTQTLCSSIFASVVVEAKRSRRTRSIVFRFLKL